MILTKHCILLHMNKYYILNKYLKLLNYEVGPGQVGPGQVGPGQVGPGQVGPEQVGPEQVGPGQVGPGQVGPEQVGPGQVGPGQVGPGQVGPGQVGPFSAIFASYPFKVLVQNIFQLLFVHALFLLVSLPEAAFGEIELHGEMMVPLVDGDHPTPSRAVLFFHECAGVQCGRHVQYVSDFHRSPSIQERKRMNHPATLAVPMIMIAATIPISMLMRSPFFRRSSDLAKPYRYSTI